MQPDDLPPALLPEPAPDPAPRRARLLGGIAVTLVLIGAGLAWVKSREGEAAPVPPRERVRDNAFLATPKQLETFRIEPVAAHEFRGERLTEGKIAVNQDRATPVFSPFSGRVLRVLAAPGEAVRAGQPLLAVEAAEFNQAHNDLVAAAGALAQARAQRTQAAVSEERKRALFEARAGAQADWQQAQADLAVAVAAERSAETALAQVRNRLRILGKSDAEIDALQKAQRVDPVATVVAPIAGTVIDRQVGPGQYIQSGAANPVFMVGDLSTVWLVANLREADASAIRTGDTAEVRVMALPGKVFRARITYVAPQVDPATRRIAVRAEVANPARELKPEMFATFALVNAETARRSPAVPSSGVVFEGEEARVWVAGDGGRIELRRVRTGRTESGLVEVVEGIKAGERVVTSGTLFIDREVRRVAG